MKLRTRVGAKSSFCIGARELIELRQGAIARLCIGAAVASAAITGPAFAQNGNLTIYGRIDSGIRYTDFKPAGAGTLFEVAPFIQSGSRLGFRGTEDLGGGLKAIFNIESGFNTDVGTLGQGGRIFGRWSYVGLGGGFGEVRLGRQEIIGNDYAPSIDPYGTAFGDAGMQSTFSSPDIGRSDNTVMYHTPNIAGFSGSVGYSLQVDGQETATGNRRMLTSGVRYRAGAVNAVVTYERFYNPAPNAPSMTLLQVGGTYDFKVVKLFAVAGQEKDVFFGGTVTNSADSRSYLLGAHVPAGALGTAIVACQRRDDRSAADDDLRVCALGYTHQLSKRTNLYSYASDADGKGTIADTAAFNRRQIAVGMRHLF